MKKNIGMVFRVGFLYLIASLFEKAIDFFLLPIFTDLLTPADYGIVSTYLSYESILTVFISLSLGNSIRTAINDFKNNLDSYISAIVTLQTIIAFFVSLITIVISCFFTSEKYQILVVFCLIHAFFACVSAIVSLRYMLESKYLKKAMLSVIPHLLTIPLSVFLIKLFPNEQFMGRILGIFTVISMVGAFYFVSILIKGKCYIKKEYWIYALKFSLPLVFHGLSLVMLGQIDRTMLTSLSGASETGIYSVAASFGTIAFAITSAMENTWIPWFYEKMNINDTKSINRISILYIWVCVLLSCGVMLLTPEIFKFFINDKYWIAIIVIPMLVAASFFKSIGGLPINAMYYIKKTKIIAFSSIVAAVINIILNFLIIPEYGALGAAFTTLISYMVLFGLQAISTHKYRKDLFSIYLFLPQIVATIILLILTYLFIDFWYIRWGCAILASLIFVIYLSKKELHRV